MISLAHQRLENSLRADGPTVKIRRPKTREVIPRGEVPNFRDHGKTVDGPLLRLLSNLARKHGAAFASEAGLRHMLAEDTGHMAGVDTIPCALERLERQGILEADWLKPGGILPGGETCTYGTRQIVLPQCRRDRRGFAVRARERNRRDGVTGRVNRHALLSIGEARAKAAKALPPLPSAAVDFERRRRAQLEAIAELERQGFDDKPPERPPD